MLSRVISCSVLGIHASLVGVEVDISAGLPAFATVGLPDSTVRESRERVSSAITNAGFKFPLRRITINLAPADIPQGRFVIRPAHGDRHSCGDRGRSTRRSYRRMSFSESCPSRALSGPSEGSSPWRWRAGTRQ